MKFQKIRVAFVMSEDYNSLSIICGNLRFAHSSVNKCKTSGIKRDGSKTFFFFFDDKKSSWEISPDYKKTKNLVMDNINTLKHNRPCSFKLVEAFYELPADVHINL